MAHRVCDTCKCKPLDFVCDCSEVYPGSREHIFSGDETLTEFCAWLFQPMHKGITAVAHNVRGYDAQFILRHLIERGVSRPEVIMRGNNILSLKAYGVRLIDSLSYLPMALAQFPKTFGIMEMAKGYFLFWANNGSYDTYVGPYLPIEMYKPGIMKGSRKDEFQTWYDEKVANNTVFDFKAEMEKYCRSDVDILRRGCGCFINLMLEIEKINPFTEALTLAGACNKSWRKNHLPSDTLGIIPDSGYPGKCKYSIKGVRWIQNESIKIQHRIKHALNGGEHRIGGYCVDGFCEYTNTVYEFHGCIFHGCPRCYKTRQYLNPYSAQSMEVLYQKTVARQKYLTEAGYSLIVMWECDFDSKCSNDKIYKKEIAVLHKLFSHLTQRSFVWGSYECR